MKYLLYNNYNNYNYCNNYNNNYYNNYNYNLSFSNTNSPVHLNDSPQDSSDHLDPFIETYNDANIKETNEKEMKDTKLEPLQSSSFFQSKNDYKEFYVIQQGILLSLLNKHCGFTLKKQKKKAKVTSAYPKVSKLYFDNETIDVQQLADTICRPVYQEECNSSKVQTAMRRFEKNKKIFVQHLLIDLLREKGYYFESKLARKSTKTYRLERIERIYYGKDLIVDFASIIEKGSNINAYFNSLFDQTSVTIQKNCEVLINYLL